MAEATQNKEEPQIDENIEAPKQEKNIPVDKEKDEEEAMTLKLLEEKKKQEALEREREEARRKKEEEERKRKEEEQRKLEMEREMALRRREQRSLTMKQMELGCYRSNNIDINKPIRIKISDIKRKHVMTAKGYLREVIGKIKLNVLNDDIINEIIYFYAKPLALKIKINSELQLRRHRDKQKDSDLIKCILYCPIDDSWDNLMATIYNEFNLSPWTDIPGIYYIDNDGQRTFISKQIWRKKEFKSWNVDNIFEMEDEKRYIQSVRRRSRERSITIKKKRRKKREDKEEEYIQKHFAEMLDNSSDDTSSSDTTSSDSSSTEHALTLKERLKNFDKVAVTGQLFTKYETIQNDIQTNDRIVKVSFDNKYKPFQISFGSDNEYIKFDDILYIALGHWTPIFIDYKYRNNRNINPNLCFSVVGRDRIIDFKGESEEIVILWVKGLRKLIGQTDDRANKLAKQGLDNYIFKVKKDLNDMEQTKETNNKKNIINDNMIIIGGIVVIGIIFIVALNRKRFFR